MMYCISIYISQQLTVLENVYVETVFLTSPHKSCVCVKEPTNISTNTLFGSSYKIDNGLSEYFFCKIFAIFMVC